MQFAVPQFTDVEDKLIGPLTLKQFLIVLAFAGLLFFFWSLFGIGVIFYLSSVPTVGLGLFITFKKLNGRPFFAYFVPLVTYMTSPRVMVFKREPAVVNFTAKQIQKEPKIDPNAPPPEPTESRLKKLAYLLDQKTEEEKDLITQNHFIDQISAPRPVAQVKESGVPGFSPVSVPKSIPTPELPPTSKKTKKFNPSDILGPKI